MKINGYGMKIPMKTTGVKLSADLEKAVSSSAANKTDAEKFGDMLMKKIEAVDAAQKTSDKVVTEFVTGKGRNLHEAVMAMEMADTSLKLMVTVRNKALEAYNEIMRMQV